MIRLAAAVYISLLMLCGGAILAGRLLAQPDDSRATWFGLCGDAPCLLGVTPGRTPWNSLYSLLSTVPGSRFGQRQVIVPVPDAEIELYPSVDGESVGRVYLTFSAGRPLAAGWVIARYGPPCGVSLYLSANLATLRYPNVLANVRLDGTRLSPGAPVLSLRFNDPRFVMESQPNPCIDNISSRDAFNLAWRGFGGMDFSLPRRP